MELYANLLTLINVEGNLSSGLIIAVVRVSSLAISVLATGSGLSMAGSTLACELETTSIAEIPSISLSESEESESLSDEDS